LWASDFLERDIEDSNILYLVQYGRLKKYGGQKEQTLTREARLSCEVCRALPSPSFLLRNFKARILMRSWQEFIKQSQSISNPSYRFEIRVQLGSPSRLREGMKDGFHNKQLC
jgi:hypothetical protein